MMSTEIKKELSENEIEFMKLMESAVLPNRHNADIGTLKNIGSLVGIAVNTTCRTCAAKGGLDMINHYGELKPKWEEYKKSIPVEPVYTKYEAVIQDEVDGFSIDEPTVIPTFDADGNLETPKPRRIIKLNDSKK